MINKATIIREKRKTLKIIIDEKKGLIVVAPQKTTLKKISEILEKKKSWIEKNMKRQSQEKIANLEFVTYRRTFLLGKIYDIEFSTQLKKISLNETKLIVPYKTNEDLKIFVRKTKKWYKNLAEIVLKQRIDELSKEHSFSFNSFKIGDFRGKWGSCDSGKNIKFNWRLLMLQPDLVDFVILHELVHTREMNHSEKFYNILFQIVPDGKLKRKALKNYSFLLNLYRE